MAIDTANGRCDVNCTRNAYMYFVADITYYYNTYLRQLFERVVPFLLFYYFAYRDNDVNVKHKISTIIIKYPALKKIFSRPMSMYNIIFSVLKDDGSWCMHTRNLNISLLNIFVSTIYSLQ